MPPVTPSAINIAAPSLRRLVVLDLLDGRGDDLGLRERRLLVLAGRHARRGSGEQLARARAGGDDELEGIRELASVDHENVLTMSCASSRIRCRRARSATTMLRRRSTAAVTSSFTTTKSYSENAATSSRATCRRR